jgi:outer membrane protein assembly factor BamB
MRHINPGRLAALVLLFLNLSPELRSEDWPEWRGKGRTGVWTETGILKHFPEEGLRFKWRTPVKWGFAGPAVSNGRVYVLDFEESEGTRTMDGMERLLCLDETTGEVLWTHRWPTSYRSLMASYATGPRATPTVDADRVYALGATGELHCLDSITGKLIWKKDFVREYGTTVPIWGISSSPLVDGSRLICLVGGEKNARVVAFNKRTGEEIWRSLSSDWEMGYAQPILLRAGGVQQLIIWHPKALASLDPETGTVFWEEPFEVPSSLTVATPVVDGSPPARLLVSQFYRGSMMVELDDHRPRARLLWKVGGTSELPKETEGLHALITTPVLDGDYIYGVCSHGELRCLNARTSERVWQTSEVGDIARWSSAFLVRQDDRYFINNDRGELIIAQFSYQGYREIDRTKLIDPTSNSAWGRRRGQSRPSDRLVNWSHPAYANRHIFARNDKEIICASLAN